eukprot:6247908-Prymnesium_polylepis.1
MLFVLSVRPQLVNANAPFLAWLLLCDHVFWRLRWKGRAADAKEVVGELAIRGLPNPFLVSSGGLCHNPFLELPQLQPAWIESSRQLGALLACGSRLACRPQPATLAVAILALTIAI